MKTKTRRDAAVAVSRRRHDAVLFDLDGVVTRTAAVHARAWKQLFDEYLKQRAERDGDRFQPFDAERDYREHVDGKPRYDGVESFLAARGIELPRGATDDPPGKETICGLGNRKNRIFLDMLHREGSGVYDAAVDLIDRLRRHGLKTAVVSSSKNCVDVLETVGLADRFDAKVDGVDSARLGLAGKPAPDIFIEAARRLQVAPARAVVVEDAVAGVEAGRRGRFALVIGVDRERHAAELAQGGADVVVADLAEIEVTDER